jgi:hypothetical protein
MGVLVSLSLSLCLAALIFMLHSGEAFVSALSFVVVLLVASIPIAIEIVGARAAPRRAVFLPLPSLFFSLPFLAFPTAAQINHRHIALSTLPLIKPQNTKT